ncbi:MAG: methyltransferase domain-containing protein [Saprospiraceae bacterium]
MNLKNYYQKRAKEYDLIYQKSERQADLKKLHSFLKNTFENKTVLEIACGTGYWTKTIAETCRSILATDVNAAVLNISKTKKYDCQLVEFKELDFWQLEDTTNAYDSLFGGFIWSHILKKDLPLFLTILQNQLGANGELIFIDNKYVEGSNTPISRTDLDGNTYQIRQLQNGEEHEVLKNFPTVAEIELLIEDMDLTMTWRELEYFWVLELRKSH